MADNDAVRRPFLVRGERLGKLVTRPPHGGPKSYPFTLGEQQTLLQPQMETLLAETASLTDEQRVGHVVFEATVYPNFLGNAYYPAALFDSLGITTLGSKLGIAPHKTPSTTAPDHPTKTLILAADDEGLQGLSSVIETPSRLSATAARQAIQMFSELRLPNASERLGLTRSGQEARALSPSQMIEILESFGEIRRTDDGRLLLEAVLHPDPRSADRPGRPAGQQVLDKWQTLVSRLGGEVSNHFIRTTGGLTFMPIEIAPETIAGVAAFNPLRSVRAMPQVGDPHDIQRSVEGERVSPEPPPVLDPAEAVLSVAMFDGGVDDESEYFRSRVECESLTPAPPMEGFTRHGTLISSAALFGDSSDGPLDPVPMIVDHYRVFPWPGQPMGHEYYWLLDVIEEVVRRESYDVVIISAGPLVSATDDFLDRWTVTLDRLSYELGTLFVVAVGNVGLRDSATELNRILVPSDMVNGIAVGATDVQSPQPVTRADYSAVGPGRGGGRIRPSGLAFGGTADLPFSGVDVDGALLEDHGTSYAAPFVVHGLADLARYLGRRRIANTNLRAFAVHFAEPARRGSGSHEVGHGRFLSRYGDAIHCSANEVHLHYHAAIARHEIVGLTLPLPNMEIPGRVKIRWTLVTLSPIDDSQSVEYTEAGLEVTFRPHTRMFNFTRDGETIVADIDDSEAIVELLQDGYRVGDEPVGKTPSSRGRGEYLLRDEGKWDTVRQWVRGYDSLELFEPRRSQLLEQAFRSPHKYRR